MTRRPRALCPFCGASSALTSQGKFWAHKRYAPDPMGGYKGTLCPGTGHKPVERGAR